ncbi:MULTISPECIES: ParB N-terminal domain-containing protein [unclassified Francisella]|uniref:ParB N-terminal domain-containing protein n=1 Tax=unclassified Francisella TaxID=2610885 RepID=UPI002E3806D0|nr:MULTISPECIES: ParB N-terminal domain-containing protein [unclassified Francisella]MED7819941.1 ParB N-terminal domain-containing protein [Francisella sp. 19S2-4]MED7830761.1 ParB N-terminal domain-containing protein [Francisella sp. 19S2-10]
MLIFSIKELSELIPSEKISKESANNLYEEILKSKAWKHPVLIDVNTNVILDGHHRFSVAKKLQLKYIPCILVDFNSSIISVTSWKTREKLCKSMILDRALSGDLFDYKTTKNVLHTDMDFRSSIPLDMLKN